MIIVYVLLLVTGFAALSKGADIFVSGSSALAKNFRVPGLVIGLTIVALGTSAPELAVSISAALRGSNEIALSNVVGSNIFNLLAVLGICAVISPLPVDRTILKRDFPLFLISAVILTAAIINLSDIDVNFLTSGMSRNVSVINRTLAIVMTLLFVAYIAYLICSAVNQKSVDDVETKTPYRKCMLYIVGGLFMIILGGRAVVYSATGIATAAGLSETLIGLTIVAVGTSLPELVTTITAARKGENAMALGNVIGSNIFNQLFILGISAWIHPVSVNLASVYDLIILLAAGIAVFVFSITSKRIEKKEGMIMLAMYISSVVFAAVR